MTSTRHVHPVTSGAVTCPHPVPDAALRIFLFHHAGGSHLLFRDWVPYFPPHWEVCLLDAPGRGRLHDLPPRGTIGDVVDFFHDELLLWMDRPFAFFGHSMGGLVAYELTHRLAEKGLPLPVWLGLSARGAPREDGGSEGTGRHLLPAGELRHWLATMGGTPRSVLEDEELWRLYEPMIRHDFGLVDTWRPRPGTPPLTVPLSAFGATGDAVVSVDRIAAWSGRAERFLGTHVYDGDHFYFRDRLGDVVGRVVADITAAERLAAGVPMGVSPGAPGDAAVSSIPRWDGQRGLAR